jgi:hypothetical protein
LKTQAKKIHAIIEPDLDVTSTTKESSQLLSGIPLFFSFGDKRSTFRPPDLPALV